MKRIVIGVCLLLALSVTVFGSDKWSTPASSSQNIKFGIGFAAGMNTPIVQQDQKSGSIFGFKIRAKLLPAIVLEPNLYFAKYGKPTVKDYPDYDLEGSKVTSYGIDAALGAPIGGTGLKFYGVGGVGYYNTKRVQTGQDDTRFGWSAGLGFEIGFTSVIALDLRGKAVVIPGEGGGSKKSASVTGGLNYYFGN